MPRPIHGELNKFHDCFNPQMRSAFAKDDNKDDEELDRKVQPKEGTSFTVIKIMMINYTTLIENFIRSRCLCLRLPLSKLAGIWLMASSADEEHNGSNADVGAVLILGKNERLGKDDFTSRMVRSKFHGENSSALSPDWTPGQLASKKMRFYLYGNLLEMR